MTDTAQHIDNGNETVTIDETKLDNRSQLLASAALIVSQTVKAEAAIGETAKTWGHALFAAVYTENASLDALIGDSKIAAGWNVLSTSEAGKKAKSRMEVYFSNARLVAERWNNIDEETQQRVLSGLSSIHYLAGQFRKADAEAKKAAKKAAELEAAKASASEAASDATVPEPAPLTLEAQVLALIDAYQAASAEEREAAYEAFALLVETVNSDVEVVAPSEDTAQAA